MRTGRRAIAACAALVALLAASGSAFAWGARGHIIVADLAEAQLTPRARATVTRLLAVRGITHLAGVANWPDALRQLDPARFQRTRRLHYVDFRSTDCRYDPPRDCRDGECIVAGIAKYTAILGNRNAPLEQRADALAFVVHFVGDIHEPLHTSDRDDAGGNRFQVQFEGRGTNLHRVWDSGLLAEVPGSAAEYAERLERNPAPVDSGGTPVEWAEEGCRLDRDGGVYPSSHRIGAAYVERELPVAEKRLREAGARLARLLNVTLAGG